jgi:uncharacterized protein (TIRG00374 family)
MRRRSTWIKLAVSVTFLLLLGLKTDWSLFMGRLREIDPFYFFLSFFITLVMIVTSCLKWRLMLDLQGARLKFPFLLRTYFIGYFFTVLLPSTVGGDVARSYYTGKQLGDQYTAAISVFFERYTGLILLLLLAVVTPFLQRHLLSYWMVRVPLLGAGLLLLLLVVFSMRERLLDSAGAIVLRVGASVRDRLEKLPLFSRIGLSGEALSLAGKIATKGRKFFRKVRQAAGCFRERPGYITWTVILTLLFYGLALLNIHVAFRVFHVEVGVFEIAALLPIIMLVSMVPITLGGVGLAEGAYVAYFSLVGLPVEGAFIMSLFLRFKLMVVASIGLFSYLTIRDHREDYAEMLAEASAEKQ